VQFLRDESNDALNAGLLGNQVRLMGGDGRAARLASSAGSLQSTQEQGQKTSTDLKVLSPPSEPMALRFLRSAGGGSLVLWIGLLAVRLVFDASWRELASVAPLAAVSRIIVGIQ
jgi:hypothetical protein